MIPNNFFSLFLNALFFPFPTFVVAALLMNGFVAWRTVEERQDGMMEGKLRVKWILNEIIQYFNTLRKLFLTF
jgi:hypothetical protein